MPRRSAAVDLNLGLRGVPDKESFSIVTASLSISSISTLIIFNGTQRCTIILQLYICKFKSTTWTVRPRYSISVSSTKRARSETITVCARLAKH